MLAPHTLSEVVAQARLHIQGVNIMFFKNHFGRLLGLPETWIASDELYGAMLRCIISVV